MRFSHSSRLLPISSSAKPSISFQRLEKNTVPSATFQSHSPSPAPSRANFQRYSLSCRAACAFLRSVTSINVARTSSSRDEPPIMPMRSAPFFQRRHIASGIAEYLGELVIKINNGAIIVDHTQRNGSPHEEPHEFLFTGSQFFLCLLLLGDVACRGISDAIFLVEVGRP